MFPNYKLGLGTAQFGLDYGINNKRGKIHKKEAFQILKFALEHGIEVLDTAFDYGDSEKFIGEFIKKNKSDFKIISKSPAVDIGSIRHTFQASLEALHLDNFYGYLIHNFKNFLDRPEIWDVLRQCKLQGRVNKIGFSLYYPQEAEYLIEKNIQIDLVQIPFSIFDQRFNEVLPLLKNKNVEVHARSVFLQGLIFRDPDGLEGSFRRIKNKLLSLRALAKRANLSMSALCINFAVSNDCIDKLIIGIDSLQQMEENLKSLTYKNQIADMHNELMNLKENNEEIILPFKWKS